MTAAPPPAGGAAAGRPRRVLLLNHNLRGEGTWYRAWNFARQLRTGGHAVTLLTVSPRRRRSCVRTEAEGIRVIETPFWGSRRLAASGLDIRDLLARFRWIDGLDWDLLWTFSSLPNVALPAFRARRRHPDRPLIADWDDLFTDGGMYERLNRGVTRPLYRWERRLELDLRRRADGVTATSRFLFEKARALRTDGRVAYLPAGADVAGIPRLRKDEARRTVPVPAGRDICVFLGGGYSEDARLLLDAFRRVAAARPDVHLLFVGDPDARYTAAGDRDRFAGRLTWMGRIPFARVPAVLGAADMLLMPLHDGLNSRARGPIKLRDYFCAGRPVVGTALGEVEYWLSRVKAGRLAAPGAEAFAAAWLDLLRVPETWEELGLRARAAAEESLSWDAVGLEINARVREWAP